jgi:hypothetical protein
MIRIYLQQVVLGILSGPNLDEQHMNANNMEYL